MKDWGHRLFGFTRKLALEKAKEVLGTESFRKILVVSQLGVKKESRDKFIEEAKKRGIDEVIEFPAILSELISLVETAPSYDSQVLQTLRLLKTYGLLKA